MKRFWAAVVMIGAAAAAGGVARAESPEFIEIAEDELADRIRGGMLGQIIGNLNGLPHEAKYIHQPGNVTDFVPHLPEGARTDDDTDLEWVYICEIQRTGEAVLPPDRIVQLWQAHINDGIWCANRYARNLMEIGLRPPLTGNRSLNPWAHFNISGQFLCESFGLMAPAMPQTASELALHYTKVAIDGEPAQATQMFASMIALAFVEPDVDRIIEGGIAAADPGSEIASIARETRRLCADNPDDWRATRQAIQERWQRHNGAIRDWNGYELNTASTIAALEYGRGDFLKTLELALNFGWDCDNNAATVAAILGVRHGRSWMNEQGWEIADVYRNTTRAGMPTDETISRFEDRVIECAKLVIERQGGEQIERGGQIVWRIPVQPPANVEPLADDDLANLRQLIDLEFSDTSDDADRARAAYVAICTGDAERLQREKSAAWKQAVSSLQRFPALIGSFKDAQIPSTAPIRERAQRAGIDLSAQNPRKVPRIDEGGWWQIASNPDLGTLTGEKQEPVDFAVWQAADGTWQLWSCIRNTKEAGVARLFHRWEGKSLDDQHWQPRGIAMRGDPAFGERRGGMQAPFVIRHDGKYLMFYGDWDSICLATSEDGKTFERASINGAGPQLFTEGPENNARDAMVLRIGDLWHCYYSAMPGDRGAMFVRRAPTFEGWRDAPAKMVVSGGSPGRMWYQAECPHVVEHERQYYLFRTSNYRDTPLTTVYRSADPTDFGIDNDSKIVATLPVAAPEVIRHDGQHWLAALNPQLDGIRLTKLEFVDP